MAPESKRVQRERSEAYYDTKSQVFSALIDTIDLSQLAKLDPESAREEIRDIVNDIIAIKNFAMSIAEQEDLLEDICNDVLGYGPLEPLLARDDIADIMVNGSRNVYIEVNGKVEQTGIRFRDNQQLLNICQRIVSQVGRRVDESSPICDARLPDGSRVNVIAPPLAIDGTALTIRKFKKDKLTLDQLVKFGSISPESSRSIVAGDTPAESVTPAQRASSAHSHHASRCAPSLDGRRHMRLRAGATPGTGLDSARLLIKDRRAGRGEDVWHRPLSPQAGAHRGPYLLAQAAKPNRCQSNRGAPERLGR